MWKLRKAKDYFGSELVEGQRREYISEKTIKGLLERLCLAEEWLLKRLLGDGYVVKAAAADVKVLARRNLQKPEKYFGDLYVVQHLRTRHISFKLYCPKENEFIWSIDKVPNLNGYFDLKCNTHILHLGNSIYTFKFPDKRERNNFRDNLHKFLFLEVSKNE